MVDIVLYHIFYKEVCDGNPQQGIGQKKEIKGICGKHVGQEKFHQVDQLFQDQGGHAAGQSHNKAQDIYKIPFTDVSAAPGEKSVKPDFLSLPQKFNPSLKNLPKLATFWQPHDFSSLSF